MTIYIFWCKKDAENKNSNILLTSNERLMLSTHCAVCNRFKNR